MRSLKAATSLLGWAWSPSKSRPAIAPSSARYRNAAIATCAFYSFRPATPVKRLVPTAITLLLRDDGTLVLRAESPDAADGFYNVDRDENSPQARWRMRRRGQELARQHGVQF